MKIAWLNEQLLYWSGGVKWILEISRRLKEKCELDVFVTRASDENKQLFKKAGLEIKEFSNISIDNARYWLFYPYFIWKNSRKLKRLLTSYDVVISTSPTTCVIASLLEHKSIFVFFEPNVLVYSPIFINGMTPRERLFFKMVHPISRFIDQTAMKKANGLVTLDNLNAARGKAIYGRQPDIIPIGVDTELFARKRNPELEAAYSNYQVIIHSATYLNPVKGTRFIVEAMPKIIEQVPNCRLLILNPHKQEKERAELMGLAQSIGVASHIEFLPPLKEEHLPDYFSLAKVVIQPSLYVSTHMPLAEGAACETPAIAFDGINADEDVVDGETGFITSSGNIDMLAQKTVELLKNPGLRAKMGKKARERVLKLFSWDHNADLMFNLAKEISNKA
jgi:glycosyltransferase involved in cell wall biosynthesis